ncbi:hypothetical protein [Geobacter anodireducens]
MVNDPCVILVDNGPVRSAGGKLVALHRRRRSLLHGRLSAVRTVKEDNSGDDRYDDQSHANKWHAVRIPFSAVRSDSFTW